MKASQRFVVLYHPQVENAPAVGQQIADYLAGRKLRVACGSLYTPELRAQTRAGEFDCCIALGGDGTMLRAGHLCAPKAIPLLGINLGRFGFLTEIGEHDWQTAVDQYLNGQAWLEKRMMLLCQHQRGEATLGSWNVLNEIVVSRGEQVRPVHLTARVDDRYLTTYVADALIAATPTGSTAYALAAGGPILPPELRNILLVAVAPHLSLDRAVVLAEGSTVHISVQSNHSAVLSVDGHPPIPMENGDCVTAQASEHTVQFVRFQDPGYFYRNLTPHMGHNPTTGNP